MHILFATILLFYIPSITRHSWHKIPGRHKLLGKYSYVPCLVGFRRLHPLCAFNFIEDWNVWMFRNLWCFNITMYT